MASKHPITIRHVYQPTCSRLTSKRVQYSQKKKRKKKILIYLFILHFIHKSERIRCNHKNSRIRLHFSAPIRFRLPDLPLKWYFYFFRFLNLSSSFLSRVFYFRFDLCIISRFCLRICCDCHCRFLNYDLTWWGFVDDVAASFGSEGGEVREEHFEERGCAWDCYKEGKGLPCWPYSSWILRFCRHWILWVFLPWVRFFRFQMLISSFICLFFIFSHILDFYYVIRVSVRLFVRHT